MASAFEMIVEIYVRDRNRKALQESLAHRRKLTDDLKSIPNGAHLALLTELTHEVALLEASLDRIGYSAGDRSGEPPHLTPAHKRPEPAELNETAAEADQPMLEARLQTPPSSTEVQIVAIDISKSTVTQSPDPQPQPAPKSAAPVRIVGLSIATSSFEAVDQRPERADERNRKSD